MSEKSSAEVIIGGKVYTLSGYEGEEYLQKVAAYINNKINEFDSMEDYRRFPTDMKATLLQLNIADDYFKAKKQGDYSFISLQDFLSSPRAGVLRGVTSQSGRLSYFGQSGERRRERYFRIRFV